jgi:hypothetical protein
MEVAMNIVNMSDAPYKYPSLTGDMLFRLWRAAIFDDHTLAEDVMRGMYHGMMAFDRERAEEVMDLTVRRRPTAGEVLNEIPLFGHRAWLRRSSQDFAAPRLEQRQERV